MSAQEDTTGMSTNRRIDLLRSLCRIRAFEEKVVQLFFGGETAGTMFHLSEGEEGAAAGVVSELEATDYVTTHHRGHGVAVVKGTDVCRMFGEIMGRVNGTCAGRGGSMHIADYSVGHINSNAIVDGNLGFGTGAALSIQRLNNKKVAVNFFGDGGMNQGILYECLNMAALWQLPVLFVCINNQYGMGTRVDQASSSVNFVERAQAFGVNGLRIDAMDVEVVADAARALIEPMRRGQGPAFLQCDCYRFYGHGRKDASPYRPKGEENAWRARDPIQNQKSRLAQAGILTEQDSEALEVEVQAEVDKAAEAALESPKPDLATLTDKVYSVRYRSDPDVRNMAHIIPPDGEVGV